MWIRPLMIVTLAAWAGPAAAQSPAEQLAQGSDLVSRWCESCHLTGAGTVGSDAAPPFQAVAQRRSDDYVRGFLSHPHTAMPPITLSNEEIEAFVTYLGSLR